MKQEIKALNRHHNQELARAVMPMQVFTTLFSCKESLRNGTIFPDLYRPYRFRRHHRNHKHNEFHEPHRHHGHHEHNECHEPHERHKHHRRPKNYK